MRQALRKALGDQGRRLFFDRFLDVLFADQDAACIAGLGLNLVCLPVNYRHFEDDSGSFELDQQGFRSLGRAIDRCARHGLHAIIDLHSALRDEATILALADSFALASCVPRAGLAEVVRRAAAAARAA